MAEEGTMETAEGDIPENFPGQIARDVMEIFQKQIDPDAAAAEASAYIWGNTGTPAVTTPDIPTELVGKENRSPEDVLFEALTETERAATA